MTPAELARELRLKIDDVPRVCMALKIPIPGEQGFTAQQFLQISRYVTKARAATNAKPSGRNDGADKRTQSNIPTDMGERSPLTPPPPKFTLPPADPLDKVQTAEAKVGKYLLKRTLGSGGMGQVWLARDTVADIDVALKVLPEAFRTNPEEQERLKRSFQMVQALPPHPAICQLRDLQHDQALGYFLVMEYIDGVTLSTYRYEYEKQHECFPLSELIRILDMIADALDYAHDRKLIHRDIKPSNVLISRDGKEVRVIDFQLAWEIRTTTSRITRDQKVDNSGTYPYMSPELWLGQRASRASDQYGLAMLTFELLDGQLPFEASDQTSWSIIVANPNTRIPEIDGLPAYAQQSLARALHFDPKQRFDTCRQFVEALGGQESRETENFVRWKATEAAKDWVAANKGTWNHQDWLQLLENLRRSEFWPMRDADIEELVNELRNDRQSQNRQQERTPDILLNAFLEEDTSPSSDSMIGQRVNVAGYPPLNDELLAAEVEHQRQSLLLKQVEDGNHPILAAGRKRLTELQQAYDALSREHERNLPQASPGVLEAVADAVARDANVSLGKLTEIPNAPKQEDLFGYVQRLKRVFAAKKDLENAQRQTLVDRQTFSRQIRKEVDQTFDRLVTLRQADFEVICRKRFDPIPSAKTAFPIEVWIRELPNIRIRRYHWSDQELLTMAESALIDRSDDLEFDAASANGSKDAYTAYLRNWPSGRHKSEAEAQFARLDELDEEQRDWETACREGGKLNYRSFILRHPHSSFCNAARKRIRINNGIAAVNQINPLVDFGTFIGVALLSLFVGTIMSAMLSFMLSKLPEPVGLILGPAIIIVYQFCEGYLSNPDA